MMLNILNIKKSTKSKLFSHGELDAILKKMAAIYNVDGIKEERKQYLKNTINRFGYLPYPQYKALDELSNAETIFCLIEKMKFEGTYDNGKVVDFNNSSPLSRRNITSSDWFKKEGHNIKLLSLAGLGSNPETPGHFMDWIRQAICLDIGSKENGILGCTIYLIPFTTREFECAYLPKSNEVSSNLQDDNLVKFLGLDVLSQVKLFIEFAQLMGHPVIYDILPQTARFSKMVLLNPSIVRWMDVNELSASIENYVDSVCFNLVKEQKFDYELVEKTKKAYIQNLNGTYKKYTDEQKPVIEALENELSEYKILLSYKMSFFDKQKELSQRAKNIIEKASKIQFKEEKDILNQDEIISALIEEGLWTYPGGAWCSSGVAVFDKMEKGRKYPLYKHYNFKGEDVSKFANLDCQSPYFFYHFELNKFNREVVDYFVDYAKNLQKEFNFDGFRVDHIDHIVDNFSQNNDKQPISYRAPYKVLEKMNSAIKKDVPYFATLAEYMLWDGYFKEYHKDMKFDLLWGDDIVAQSTKTPEQIINDNLRLSCYNQKFGKSGRLSILKGYNNQDGEFREINQYPGQLGENGALFKWFKLKFLVGGKYASRPTLLIDGDESYTIGGIERIISKEVSMERNRNWEFFEKFNAINYFAQNDKLLNNGKASLIEQKNNGFCAFEINFEGKDKNYSYLIAANYFAPNEIKDGKKVKGKSTKANTIKLKSKRTIVSDFIFDFDENQKCLLTERHFDNPIKKQITFDELQPSEFKIYKVMQTP